MKPSKNMRKALSFYETKTLESKTAPPPLSFGLYTLFLCDLKLVVKGRTYPLHRNWKYAQILQKLHIGTGTSKCGTGTTMLLVIFCLGYRYRFAWYQYQKATGHFLLGGTGTGLPGTSTTTSTMFPHTVTLPETSQ